MEFLKKEKYLHLFSWLICLGYFLPYIILGEDISITIHDNLDSNLVWLKLIFENTNLTTPNSAIIPNIMNGVPLSSLAPVYDLQFFIFKTLGIFNGYVTIRFLMIVIGFYGMRSLLKNQFTELKTHPVIIYGVSVCFALLPHWGYNLSIATLPIIFNALLNIQNAKANKWNFVAIIFVGATSSLILVGMFVIAGFGLFGLLKWYTDNRNPVNLYKGLLLLSATYILTHIRLFVGVLNPNGNISHRTEFELLFDWPGLIFSRATSLLTEGWYHAASIHQLILLVIPIALFVVWKKNLGYKFINAIEFIIISCLWYSLVNWSGVLPITSLITSIVPIQLQRLHFIQPLVWYVLFALSLLYLVKYTRWGKIVAPILIIVQIVVLFFNHEGYTQREEPSYRAFYATALFDEVKAHLGPDRIKERCIFISSHPAILQYNGLYTLDGYLADYPLEYKHDFGEFIQGELDKNEILKRGYTRWGSRAYAMVGQLGKNWIHTNSDSETIQGLDYEWSAFADLGGKYILSPLPIEDSNLSLEKVFEHQEAAWRIHLYTLK